jgi:hypothetical protein
MRNIYSPNSSSSTIILLTMMLMMLLSVVLIVIYLMKKEHMFENFEDKKKSASESVSDALVNIIKSANKVGKRMLNPELWNERIGMLNKSPMDLARMHIIKHS